MYWFNTAATAEENKSKDEMNISIETKNLNLIPCNSEILKNAIDGNEKLAKFLGVNIADNWTEFGVAALKYSLDRLAESPEDDGWWTYFPIHKQDNMLIGSGGYKGRPTETGTVELGYEIAPDYRNNGLATEMTEGLISNAFADKRVKVIVAHTLGEVNASIKVLTKCRFEKVEEINDPDDGLIWKWELKRKP
ncbi:MAG: GNAT family N-acetyltransferase [Calditrichaceae bacterium]